MYQKVMPKRGTQIDAEGTCGNFVRNLGFGLRYPPLRVLLVISELHVRKQPLTLTCEHLRDHKTRAQALGLKPLCRAARKKGSPEQAKGKVE